MYVLWNTTAPKFPPAYFIVHPDANQLISFPIQGKEIGTSSSSAHSDDFCTRSSNSEIYKFKYLTFVNINKKKKTNKCDFYVAIIGGVAANHSAYHVL